MCPCSPSWYLWYQLASGLEVRYCEHYCHTVAVSLRRASRGQKAVCNLEMFRKNPSKIIIDRNVFVNNFLTVVGLFAISILLHLSIIMISK